MPGEQNKMNISKVSNILLGISGLIIMVSPTMPISINIETLTVMVGGTMFLLAISAERQRESMQVYGNMPRRNENV